MTLMEIGFRLQEPLTPEQMGRLAQFANTYGMRRFALSENDTVLRFEYDASRLRNTQVEHVLRMAGIPVAERLTTYAPATPTSSFQI
jgi:hypothetical protein